MHAISTHHAHQQPMHGWRHVFAHARARVSHLRERTTLGPLGPVDAPYGVTPILRDYPYPPNR